MHKVIALFNHKGGVSKTTTTFNLGWMLAEMGHRVVMVDTDPQCNLTGLVMDFDTTRDFDQFYASNPDSNIQAGLAPAFESQPRPIKAVKCVEVTGRPGLLLVPGHVNLSEYEVTLGIAQELSGSLQALRNLPGAFRYFVDRVAEDNRADYVLVDMSPSLGALNQNFLMTSDFFLVPAAPDYFCVMAIESLTAILPKWIEWAKRAANVEPLKTASYPFPTPTLKFLGTVIQRYRPRKGKAAEGFQTWIDQINSRVSDRLFPTLSKFGTTLPSEVYAAAEVKASKGYCLAEIADFNSLITASQKHQTPVFALTDEMFDHVGTVLQQDKQKRDEFKETFTFLAGRVVQLVTNA